MRTSALLLVALLAVTIFAEPDPNEATGPDVEKFEVKDSQELMKTIQGINEDKVWIVQFYDLHKYAGKMTTGEGDDKEEVDADMEAKIKNSLTNNDKLKVVPYNTLKYRLTEVNVNNKKFDDAMEALGMTSN
jgi:hypothetical protein